MPTPVSREHWSMYFDSSFTLNRAGEGVVLISPKGDWLLYVIRPHFGQPTIWRSMRPLSMACASLLSSGSSGFTSAVTQSSSSNVSRGSRIVLTPTWRHTDRGLESLRRSSMVLSSIISFGETMKQPTPSSDLGQAMNRPLRACLCRTYSSRPSDFRKRTRHPHQGPRWVKIA
jgi:hypothetical protein